MHQFNHSEVDSCFASMFLNPNFLNPVSFVDYLFSCLSCVLDFFVPSGLYVDVMTVLYAEAP